MIVHDCEQGSEEWVALRLGIPTGSNLDRILTPKTRRPSAQQAAYIAELVAERLTGESSEGFSSEWTEHGSIVEEEARTYYEFQRGVTVQRVGFVTRDDGLVGGSPDGLIGEDGGLEIKCPSPKVHASYLLGTAMDYVGQCQGYMYLTDRKWWDLLAYHQTMPAVIVRVERDEKYMAALAPLLDEFVMLLDEAERLARLGRAL